MDPLKAICNSSYFNFFAEPIYTHVTDFAKKAVAPRFIDYSEIALSFFCGMSASFPFRKVQTLRQACTFTTALATGLIASRVAYCAFRDTFKKKWIEEKINKITSESKHQENKKKILVIKTTHDPNSAFSNHATLAHFKIFAKNHAITLMNYSNFDLNLVDSKSFKAVIVMGHGNNASVSLGENIEISSKDINFPNRLKRLMTNDGIIVLQSCKAAAGENSLKGAFDKIFSPSNVYGPKGSINAFSGVKYNSETLIPIFQ